MVFKEIKYKYRVRYVVTGREYHRILNLTDEEVNILLAHGNDWNSIIFICIPPQNKEESESELPKEIQDWWNYHEKGLNQQNHYDELPF